MKTRHISGRVAFWIVIGGLAGLTGLATSKLREFNAAPYSGHALALPSRCDSGRREANPVGGGRRFEYPERLTRHYGLPSRQVTQQQ